MGSEDEIGTTVTVSGRLYVLSNLLSGFGLDYPFLGREDAESRSEDRPECTLTLVTPSFPCGGDFRRLFELSLL